MEPKTYGEEDIVRGARAGMYLARYIEDKEVEEPRKKFKLELPDERSIMGYFNEAGALASNRSRK